MKFDDTASFDADASFDVAASFDAAASSEIKSTHSPSRRISHAQAYLTLRSNISPTRKGGFS
ncbi:MAG: AbfB domain-containing protein [Clostridia bacterium]|nr:AbfB domain-containing protein [Clostridia bacterium]